MLVALLIQLKIFSICYLYSKIRKSVSGDNIMKGAVAITMHHTTVEHIQSAKSLQ